ncbi:hypothetical protein N431DRAFT_332239 [Stipitochalara longipes BDJ]|nr:hypothetical protein N431DRAFT_332239 [Stipitochalara longipes BDJ]
MSKWKSVFSPLDGTNGKLDREPAQFRVLSLGVELEFSLATIPYNVKDPELDGREVYGIMEEERKPNAPEHTTPKFRFEVLQRIDRAERTQRHIAKTLVKAGSRAIAQPDMSLDPPDMPLDRWIVTDDSTIQAPPAKGDRKRYVFQKVELISPAFLATKGSLVEIQRTCQLIIRTYRTCGGPSTGLHIHVGNCTRGFDLETLQNVMAILWTFELQLATLHPKYRRDNDYCLPLRRSSGLALQMVAEKINLRNSLEIIYKTTSINNLIWLMGAADGSGYKMCVNIHNLIEPYVDAGGVLCGRDDGTKKTIEFRQHEGTLNPEAVYQWCKVCLKIIEFAQECPTWKLRIWLTWHINNRVEGYPAVAVLYALKLPHSAQYYENKLAKGDEVSAEL